LGVFEAVCLRNSLTDFLSRQLDCGASFNGIKNRNKADGVILFPLKGRVIRRGRRPKVVPKDRLRLVLDVYWGVLRGSGPLD